MSQLVEDARAASRLPTPAKARHIRMAASVSQAAMAQELGVHRVTLARWETGHLSPSGTRRAQYARLLEELQRAVTAA